MYYNVFGQSPIIIQQLGDLPNFKLSYYDKEASEIARKIADEQIQFEGIIPDEYLQDKNIFESIVTINPQLLENSKNRIYLEYFTKGMTDSETMDYYKKLGVPFNRETVIPNNILSVLECLKNDYMTSPDTKKQYTKEEYKEMYELIKDNLELEQILENSFLTQNPYFATDLIKSGIDLTNIDLRETKYYDEFYPDLKAIALKNGTDIPRPKDYKQVIKFDDNNQVYIELDSLESLTKGLKYIEEKNFDQDLHVVLRQEEFDEFVISDNIEFFENLAKNNANINFSYDTSNKIFSLKEILDNEHFMQYVAEDIKSKNFSPLEQLIAVYDIAKAFKPFKDEENSIAESRALYEYLGNEYMVCAGYSDLVSNLGHRLGAPYSKIGLQVQNIESGKEVGHARNYVNIVDPKYEIDGFYALDATWERKW